MAVYAITGELGSGKSLLCVSKMRDALLQGRRVVTNFDLRAEHLVGPENWKASKGIHRCSDFPSADELLALGSGGPSTNEKTFGLLVLDEVGSFLNSRQWPEKDRMRVVDWFKHARKFRWHVFLVVQDLSHLDKQIRVGFVEHVVRCRRTDRYGLPLIGWIFKLFGFKVTLPQHHFALVKYGVAPLSPIVERWFYSPSDLGPAYDTEQKIMGDGAPYSVLGHNYRWIRKPNPKWRVLENLERLIGVVLRRPVQLPLGRGEIRWRVWNLAQQGIYAHAYPKTLAEGSKT